MSDSVHLPLIISSQDVQDYWPFGQRFAPLEHHRGTRCWRSSDSPKATIWSYLWSLAYRCCKRHSERHGLLPVCQKQTTPYPNQLPSSKFGCVRLYGRLHLHSFVYFPGLGYLNSRKCRSRVQIPCWPLADVVLGSPEFNFSAMRVSSQVVCLPPAGIFKLVTFIWIFI